MSGRRLIETNEFPFEFLSLLAKRESWRKEIHRPIYHVHKWWAKRLGSVFRGLALGSTLDADQALEDSFYAPPSLPKTVVFDPFMGSGTTIGESHKLGLTALGRDINPVAVEAARVAFSELDEDLLEESFAEIDRTVGNRIQRLYYSKDSLGRLCQVLYYFWVMELQCPLCSDSVDLFPSWIRARNAYPKRKPEVQILCPSCGSLFEGHYKDTLVQCTACSHEFDPRQGPARGSRITCGSCAKQFTALDAVARAGGGPPAFRLYGKLVLTKKGDKEYLPASEEDIAQYNDCKKILESELKREGFKLPSLELSEGYNTRQAMAYGFTAWRQFFNVRQLLALGWLHEAIAALPKEKGRGAFLTLFSGVLEFNNMFASYKGEGTGAVRHMFSHHILKPERTPIEANLWGTPKSSGSFSGLFRTRLLRAARYQKAPTELNGVTNGERAVVCSPAFSGQLEADWPTGTAPRERRIYLSCGDSASSGLGSKTVDLVLTDPPFFDNVHYSELADFFYAWQQVNSEGPAESTRADEEVQDVDADGFSQKLESVFRECNRVLRDDGLLVFTYHHSRDEGWTAVAKSILGAGFQVVNAHPLKAEMSVATPKAQAKEPIQLDIAVVCRKHGGQVAERPTQEEALAAARAKIERLQQAGFSLSLNDRRTVLFGQLLTAMRSPSDLLKLADATVPQIFPTSIRLEDASNQLTQEV